MWNVCTALNSGGRIWAVKRTRTETQSKDRDRVRRPRGFWPSQGSRQSSDALLRPGGLMSAGLIARCAWQHMESIHMLATAMTQSRATPLLGLLPAPSRRPAALRGRGSLTTSVSLTGRLFRHLTVAPIRKPLLAHASSITRTSLPQAIYLIWTSCKGQWRSHASRCQRVSVGRQSAWGEASTPRAQLLLWITRLWSSVTAADCEKGANSGQAAGRFTRPSERPPNIW